MTAESIGCPLPANPFACSPTFVHPLRPSVLADGNYALHYFAQDCAGTEELKFIPVGNGGWAAAFHTVPINVDTVVPHDSRRTHPLFAADDHQRNTELVRAESTGQGELYHRRPFDCDQAHRPSEHRNAEHGHCDGHAGHIFARQSHLTISTVDFAGNSGTGSADIQRG